MNLRNFIIQSAEFVHLGNLALLFLLFFPLKNRSHCHQKELDNTIL